jgi:hypothetical protein
MKTVIPQTNYVPGQPKAAMGEFEMTPFRQVTGLAGAAAGAYHGYKRNNSVGWAIGWALLGGAFPIITVPVSLAQGFGKKKKK